MVKEHEGRFRTPLTGIHINLEERSIEFEDKHGTVAKLRLAANGVIFDGGSARFSGGEDANKEGNEDKQTVTLTGRLKAKPRQGRPDRSGNPTAYARMSAHVEGEEGTHDYIATFHRHTAPIALSLANDAQITVEGYPHPSRSEGRLDTLSVFNIVNYPGQARGARR